MIKEKKFENLENLNTFVKTNDVKIINVETYNFEYDTGLPLMNGTTFVTTHQGKRLLYTENKK